MARKLIRVKKSHIEAGEARSYTCCPIALALQDKGYPRAFVSTQAVMPTGRYGLELPLPEQARHFVQLFDSREKPEPFSFYLDLPEVVNDR